MRRRRATRRALPCLLALAVAVPASAGPPLPVLADGVTARISTRADGSQATDHGVGDVSQPSISANGRYAVFSTTFDLKLGACSAGVYLRDLKTGRLEMISVPARGCGPEPTAGGGANSYTSISADGRYVAFTSAARDLVAGPLLPELSPSGNMIQHVFLRDRARKRTVLVSVGYDGKPANGRALRPSVSDDGRFVAFETAATNIVRGVKGDPDHPLRYDVYLRDLVRGVTVRVGPNALATGRGPKWYASISGNGRYVAFDAEAGDLAPSKGTGGGVLMDDTPSYQVYVWDRVTNRTELVSRNDDGYAALGHSTLGPEVSRKLSRDGRWVTFESSARNLTGPNGTGLYSVWQVYLHDRVTRRTTQVSAGVHGLGGNGESRDPCISSDGRYVSFASAASDLGDVDLTPTPTREEATAIGTDVYLYDRVSGRTRLVTRSSDGVQADRNSRESCPSDGGRHVVFVSHATTLVPGDTNDDPDVFVRDYTARPAR